MGQEIIGLSLRKPMKKSFGGPDTIINQLWNDKLNFLKRHNLINLNNACYGRTMGCYLGGIKVSLFNLV